MVSTPSLRDELGALLPRLRRFARGLAGDVADADDLVQTALERALSRASQWDARDGGLAPWVLRIIVHWAQGGIARRAVGRGIVSKTVCVLAAALVDLGAVLAAWAIGYVVALVLVEGLSYREAAESLDIPVGTVTSRLARARQDLQRMLGEESP